MRALLFLMWLLHFLPLPVLGRLGHLVGAILFRIARRRRHITLTNLALCLPQLEEAERQRIARAHFQAYARSVLERSLLWWASTERLMRLIRIDPEVPVDAIKASPTILLCPHFVCLDVAGVAIKQYTDLCSMYSRQRNEVFNAALLRGRLRFGPVTLVTRDDGIKPILRALRQGLPYLMLPDMDFGPRDSVFVPFFGIPAATLAAPGRIAAATGAKVIPVVATYLPNFQGWRVRFYPPWENYPGDDITAATARMNAFIEERVLEAPEQYFWAHKRFKTRPPGEPGFYEQQGDGPAEAADDEVL